MSDPSYRFDLLDWVDKFTPVKQITTFSGVCPEEGYYSRVISGEATEEAAAVEAWKRDFSDQQQTTNATSLIWRHYPAIILDRDAATAADTYCCRARVIFLTESEEPVMYGFPS